MQGPGKRAIILYEPLITFANAEITEKTWRNVLNGLGSRPTPSRKTGWQAFREWVDTYHRLGFIAPLFLDSERITGPQPLRVVQQELQDDLDCLTDPGRDLQPSAKEMWDFAQSGEEQREMEAYKNLSWLETKINGLTRKGQPRRTLHSDGKTPVYVQKVGEIEIPMMLVVHRARSDDFRVLLTDRVSFVPVINDLRVWVYFRLAHLWADGFLPRIGHCQNEKCRRFFLAKTSRAKKLYCSQRCAQAITAVERVKKSRERRTKWTHQKTRLGRLLADIQVIAHKQKLQRPRSEREILEEAEDALRKARDTFANAFRRKQGETYEEGQAFLTQATDKIKRLHKKVKGY